MNSEPSKSKTTTLSAPDVEALLVKARAVFAGNEQEHGTPEAPTQAGFLALARAGKEVWNAWRKAYPEPIPNFSGMDFRKEEIDFSGFFFSGGGGNSGDSTVNSCTIFSSSRFDQVNRFKGAQFGKYATFVNAKFEGLADFSGALFEGDVSFQSCTFAQGANFEEASFGGVPNFHGCTLHQNTSFYKTGFSAPSSVRAARAYRTLKLASAQQHAFHEEQRFFKLEMQAEAGIAEYPKRLMYQLYEALSDYGSSLLRPTIFWILCLLIFAFGYGYLGLSFSPHNIDYPVTVQWIKFSLLNAIPLPGFAETMGLLRTKLFPDVSIELIVIILEILHKTFSLLAFFLIGLALRNLFKMKG